MIAAVVAALEAGDYPQAETLLQDMSLDRPPVVLCWAWLEEKKEHWDASESHYRALLRQDCGPKITLKARQGLERLVQKRKQHHEAALQRKLQAPGSTQRAIAILEPIANPETKGELARHLARIMELEPYAARMLLPSRGWRFFRTGPLGELDVYGSELRACGIPLFWLPLDSLDAIQVLEVRYLQALTPQVQACWAPSDSPQTLEVFTFNWAEVTQRVEGLLPIFENVVDLDPRGNVKYKKQIQDHAQCCDLHLPGRQTILRFYRGAYQFNQGIDLSPPQATAVAADLETSWANWRQLLALFKHYRPDIPSWQDFTLFAETVIDQTELLSRIKPHIDLFRREECYWDHAFQLYSGLVMHHSLTADQGNTSDASESPPGP